MPNTTDLAASPSSPTSSSSTSSGPTASGSSSSLPGSTNTRTKTNVAAIVGPIVGISAALLLAVGFFMWWQRRRLALSKEAEVLETSAPFAPAARGELWYNGVEIGPGAPQPITYTAPVSSGKRAQMVQARVLQPPPPESTNPGSANGETLWSTNPPSTAPQTVVQQPPSVTQPQIVDVNHIIELIAQRIDPAGRSNDDIAPPEYHVQ
ncbi:hypothetical protein EIP86_009753 [Pleurotus ostreatoroseus]|nr:hypothetical protein EIP86_009753 [Pleurotus ostreatoroseus]